MYVPAAVLMLRPVVPIITISAIITIVAIIPIAEAIVLLAIATERTVAPLLPVSIPIVVVWPLVPVVLPVILPIILAVILPAIAPSVLPVILPPVVAIRRTLLLRLPVALSITGLRLPSLHLVWLLPLRSTRLWTAAEVVAALTGSLLVDTVFGQIESIRSRHPARLPVLRLFARRLKLFTIGHDDAVVVLGMLQIILCQHPITGRLRIARQRQIFLGNMRRCPANFNIRPV